MTYHSIFRPGLFNDQVFIITGGGTGSEVLPGFSLTVKTLFD